jgi:hypothetical protein
LPLQNRADGASPAIAAEAARGREQLAFEELLFVHRCAGERISRARSGRDRVREPSI